jgi:sugar phosphate isomerase/epimerase
MKLLFFCPRWGQADLSWDDFATKVKQSDYDGVETDIPADPQEKDLLLNALAKHGLLLVAQHWETVTPGYQQHFDEYCQVIERLAEAKPLFVNSQTGKDYYSFAQNKGLIKAAERISDASGVPVYHETHRGKFSFAAHITHDYLQRIDGLQLTLDISHWCTVAETFLHDQPDAIDMALSRTKHIHARVGFTEGPQVNDPRAPEWATALQFHLECWDTVVNLQKEKGAAYLGFTTEFGPFPYMPRQPFTQQPLADQWEVNLFMKNLLKNRYRK